MWGGSTSSPSTAASRRASPTKRPWCTCSSAGCSSTTFGWSPPRSCGAPPCGTSWPRATWSTPSRADVAAPAGAPRRRDLLFWLVLFVGATTVVTGLAEVVAPGVVLDALGAEKSETSRQLFATVGMFMVVVGAGLTHALLAAGDHRVLLLWAGLQKLGAVIAVSAGVARGVFRTAALLVALNDLVSSGLVFWYRRRAS